MKLLTFMTIILYMATTSSQVVCNDIDCVGEEITFDREGNKLEIDLHANKTETVTNQSTNEAMNLIIKSNDLSSENTSRKLNLTIQGTTLNSNYGSPYHTLLSEISGYLSITLDGRSGDLGKNSDQICAENFVAGMFGQDAKDFFEDRRISNNSLSSNVCTSEDILFLESRFSCDEGETFSNRADIEVARTAERRMCSGTFRRAVCLKRRATLNCKTLLAGNNCCTENPVAMSPATGSYYGSLDSWSCDPALCQVVEGKSYNGLFKSYEINYWEHQLENIDLNNECSEVYENSNETTSLVISWEDPTINDGTILNLRDEFGTIFRDGQSFQIPNIVVTGSQNYTIGIESSSVEVTDCLGLNGSLKTSTLCTKTVKSEESEITLFVISEAGIRSENELSIKTQGNREAYARTYNNTFYYGLSPHTNGGVLCEAQMGSNNQYESGKHYADTRVYTYTIIDNKRYGVNRTFYHTPALEYLGCFPQQFDISTGCEEAFYPVVVQGQITNLNGQACGASGQPACPIYPSRSKCFERQAALATSTGNPLPVNQRCQEVRQYPVYNGTILSQRAQTNGAVFGTTYWSRQSCDREGFF